MRPHPVALAALAVLLPLAGSAAPRAFVVDGSGSAVRVHVGKSGVLSFAGHSHDITATGVEGTIEADPDDLARSSVSLAFAAAGLKVEEQGEPAGDAAKVQEVMAGDKVLDVARFASIEFRSRQVSGRRAADGAYELQVAGELSLHGVTKPLTVPVRVEVSGGTLTATGRATVAQRAFGIEPVTAGGGTVKVKNEVGIDFRIVAREK